VNPPWRGECRGGGARKNARRGIEIRFEGEKTVGFLRREVDPQKERKHKKQKNFGGKKDIQLDQKRKGKNEPRERCPFEGEKKRKAGSARHLEASRNGENSGL